MGNEHLIFWQEEWKFYFPSDKFEVTSEEKGYYTNMNIKIKNSLKEYTLRVDSTNLTSNQKNKILKKFYDTDYKKTNYGFWSWNKTFDYSIEKSEKRTETRLSFWAPRWNNIRFSTHKVYKRVVWPYTELEIKIFKRSIILNINNNKLNTKQLQNILSSFYDNDFVKDKKRYLDEKVNYENINSEMWNKQEFIKTASKTELAEMKMEKEIERYSPDIYKLIKENKILTKVWVKFKDWKIIIPDKLKHPQLAKRIENSVRYMWWLDSWEAEALKVQDKYEYQMEKIRIFKKLNTSDVQIIWMDKDLLKYRYMRSIYDDVLNSWKVFNKLKNGKYQILWKKGYESTKQIDYEIALLDPLFIDNFNFDFVCLSFITEQQIHENKIKFLNKGVITQQKTISTILNNNGILWKDKTSIAEEDLIYVDWEHTIKKQVETKLKNAEDWPVRTYQELLYLKSFIENRDYLEEERNDTLFREINRYNKFNRELSWLPEEIKKWWVWDSLTEKLVSSFWKLKYPIWIIWLLFMFMWEKKWWKRMIFWALAAHIWEWLIKTWTKGMEDYVDMGIIKKSEIVHSLDSKYEWDYWEINTGLQKLNNENKKNRSKDKKPNLPTLKDNSKISSIVEDIARLKLHYKVSELDPWQLCTVLNNRWTTYSSNFLSSNLSSSLSLTTPVVAGVWRAWVMAQNTNQNSKQPQKHSREDVKNFLALIKSEEFSSKYKDENDVYLLDYLTAWDVDIMNRPYEMIAPTSSNDINRQINKQLKTAYNKSPINRDNMKAISKISKKINGEFGVFAKIEKYYEIFKNTWKQSWLDEIDRQRLSILSFVNQYPEVAKLLPNLKNTLLDYKKYIEIKGELKPFEGLYDKHKDAALNYLYGAFWISNVTKNNVIYWKGKVALKIEDKIETLETLKRSITFWTGSGWVASLEQPFKKQYEDIQILIDKLNEQLEEMLKEILTLNQKDYVDNDDVIKRFKDKEKTLKMTNDVKKMSTSIYYYNNKSENISLKEWIKDIKEVWPNYIMKKKYKEALLWAKLKIANTQKKEYPFTATDKLALDALINKKKGKLILVWFENKDFDVKYLTWFTTNITLPTINLPAIEKVGNNIKDTVIKLEKQWYKVTQTPETIPESYDLSFNIGGDTPIKLKANTKNELDEQILEFEKAWFKIENKGDILWGEKTVKKDQFQKTITENIPNKFISCSLNQLKDFESNYKIKDKNFSNIVIKYNVKNNNKWSEWEISETITWPISASDFEKLQNKTEIKYRNDKTYTINNISYLSFDVDFTSETPNKTYTITKDTQGKLDQAVEKKEGDLRMNSVPFTTSNLTKPIKEEKIPEPYYIEYKIQETTIPKFKVSKTDFDTAASSWEFNKLIPDTNKYKQYYTFGGEEKIDEKEMIVITAKSFTKTLNDDTEKDLKLKIDKINLDLQSKWILAVFGKIKASSWNKAILVVKASKIPLGIWTTTTKEGEFKTLWINIDIDTLDGIKAELKWVALKYQQFTLEDLKKFEEEEEILKNKTKERIEKFYETNENKYRDIESLDTSNQDNIIENLKELEDVNMYMQWWWNERYWYVFDIQRKQFTKKIPLPLPWHEWVFMYKVPPNNTDKKMDEFCENAKRYFWIKTPNKDYTMKKLQELYEEKINIQINSVKKYLSSIKREELSKPGVKSDNVLKHMARLREIKKIFKNDPKKERILNKIWKESIEGKWNWLLFQLQNILFKKIDLWTPQYSYIINLVQRDIINEVPKHEDMTTLKFLSEGKKALMPSVTVKTDKKTGNTESTDNKSQLDDTLKPNPARVLLEELFKEGWALFTSDNKLITLETLISSIWSIYPISELPLTYEAIWNISSDYQLMYETKIRKRKLKKIEDISKITKKSDAYKYIQNLDFRKLNDSDKIMKTIKVLQTWSTKFWSLKWTIWIIGLPSTWILSILENKYYENITIEEKAKDISSALIKDYKAIPDSNKIKKAFLIFIKKIPSLKNKTLFELKLNLFNKFWTNPNIYKNTTEALKNLFK
jgi:hypothetical protein